MTARTAPHGFTGRHMLVAMISFFGVVIGVNVTMAWYASSSWSGLVVENTYVASQEFNAKAAAMKALAASGVAGTLSIRGNEIDYAIRNKDGLPADVDDVTLSFRRPVGDHEDFQVPLSKVASGHFKVRHEVRKGDWIVEIVSRKAGAVVMHEARRLDTAEFGQ
ncbi:FixH family protein [Rhizobium mesoamericanum]|uniref:Nitrogen fixation protein fixH n=1 Tax=Rhizobium mesoamericanum STM3625 TaxID=1211777 RepID=K0PYD4_9HYPH|nr:FixH family protein [Rhizobium mesoamericanum]CCM78983.1 Nitrogen fixation protein fixH [Rhizobium mesoamericanum STM3625]